MTNDHEALFEAQAEALYLEPADLEANRQGFISENQVERIHGQMRAATVGLGCMVLATILPVIAFAAYVQSVTVVIVMGLGLALLGIRFLYTLREINSNRRQIESDLATGVATSLEGTLQKREVGRRAGHQLGVDGEFFVVPRLVYDAARDDQSAIIYFLPESKQLLAIELLNH